MLDPMADPEQLALIRRSVKEWAAWKEKNPDVQVDLSGADLSGMDLTDANFY